MLLQDVFADLNCVWLMADKIGKNAYLI